MSMTVPKPLSFDIWVLIADWIEDRPTLCSLALVNSRFNAVATPRLYEEITYSLMRPLLPPNTVTPPEVIICRPYLARYVKKMRTEWEDHRYHWQRPIADMTEVESIASLIRSLPNLRVFEWSNHMEPVHAPVILSALQTRPHLEEMGISVSIGMGYSGYDMLGLTELRTLRKLEILHASKYSQVDYPAKVFENLTHLTIKCTIARDILPPPTQLRNLTFFVLSFGPVYRLCDLFVEDIVEIFRQLPNIRHLEFPYRCKPSTDSLFFELIDMSKLTRIRSMVIRHGGVKNRGCYQALYACIRSIISRSPIESLDVLAHGCRKWKDRSNGFISHLARKHGHTLRRLHLEMSHPSAKAIALLCSLCPNLEDLGIDLTRHSEKTLAASLAAAVRLASITLYIGIQHKLHWYIPPERLPKREPAEPSFSYEQVRALVVEGPQNLRTVVVNTRPSPFNTKRVVWRGCWVLGKDNPSGNELQYEIIKESQSIAYFR